LNIFFIGPTVPELGPKIPSKLGPICRILYSERYYFHPLKPIKPSFKGISRGSKSPGNHGRSPRDCRGQGLVANNITNHLVQLNFMHQKYYCKES